MKVKDIEKIIVKKGTIIFISKDGTKERHRKSSDWLQTIDFLVMNGALKLEQIEIKN